MPTLAIVCYATMPLGPSIGLGLCVAVTGVCECVCVCVCVYVKVKAFKVHTIN